jgi:hypothetical protein
MTRQQPVRQQMSGLSYIQPGDSRVEQMVDLPAVIRRNTS